MTAAAPPLPNVLFLCADDHRADALGFLGHPLQTPAWDRLAREGAAFTHTFTTVPICTPARAELLSGCNAFTTGVRWFGETTDPSLTTLPQAFAAAGYQTFFTGKWHNDGTPDTRGYETTRRVFVGGMRDHAMTFEENGETVSGFSSELFAGAALDFLGGGAGRDPGRDPSRPWLVHVAFTAPHDPRTPPPGWRPDPATVPLPPNYLPEHPFDNGEMTIRDEQLERWPRTPDAIRGHLADYYGMLAHLDVQVGRLLNVLDETGQAENTLVVYTGDHGLAVGSHGLLGKMSMYDHSVRVPLILRGPGVPAGFRSNALCQSYDLLPTLCDLAGVPVPPSVREGRSLRPALENPAAEHRDAVFGAYRDVQRMIRTPRWKYIEYPHINKSQLFDLHADPHELSDLLLSWRYEKTNWYTPPSDGREIFAVADELRARLRDWQRTVGDPLLTEARDFNPSNTRSRETNGRPMNFILFNPDEMRAESAGCYGHPIAPTPSLDRLAAEGTRFDQCHVQHPVCTPSRCSFMTGWYPHVRGHRTLWHALRPDEPNLLKYLKQAGYDVLWGGKNDLLAPESFVDSVTDFRLGDRSRRAVRGAPAGRNPFSPDDPRYHSFLYEPTGAPLEALGDFANVDGAIEYLKSGPTRPFCLYLPLTFPHCPYFAPGGWHDLVDPDALPPLRPAGRPGKPNFHALIRQTRRLNELDQAFFRKLNAVYLGMIGVVDHLLGLLLDALDQSGHADDTAVLFFSDHGDWAGDYGLVEKWPSALDDTITRVPFVARVPGAGTRGHVAREPIELFDLLPTVLDLAGVPARHTHFARSLVPQLGGAPGNPGRAVFAEGGYARHEPHCFEGTPHRDTFARDPGHIYYPKGKLQQDHPQSVCRAAMIRTATHKLIRRPDGQSELYDLAADPRELANVHGDPAFYAVQRALETRLLDWYVQTADVTPFDEDPRGFPPVAAPALE